MSYKTVVNVIRGVANDVAPQGTFTHGRRSDSSLEFSGLFPQIHLFPFTGSIDITNSNIITYNITMLFCGQDTPDSSNEEREDIIQAMDELSNEFIKGVIEADGVSCTGFRKEPNYRVLAGTTSGYIISFNLTTACSLC